MDQSNRINPGHTRARNFLRIVGPIVLGLGLLFTIISLVSFFMAMGGMEPPRLFWMGFVGLPLIFVGIVMTSTGFMGAIAHYHAAEIAPVGVDTTNYVAKGVAPAIKDVTRAVVDGIAEARVDQYCTKCGAGNDSDATFCKKCGQRLTSEPAR